MDEKHQNFINEHLNDNINELSLKASRYPDIEMPFVIRQIDARQRIKGKVPSWYYHTSIEYPAKLAIEQSSSELTANYKQSLISDYQGVMADLTGGLGVDFTFLSKNFHKAFYIEENKDLCILASTNFEILGLKNFQIQNIAAQQFIEETGSLDFVYVDPHRRNKSGHKSVQIKDCSPDISVLLPLLIQKASHILIKLSPMLDIHQAISALHIVSEIHIVAVENECKEVLILINNHKQGSSQPEIHAVNIRKNGDIEKFSFDYDEERTVNISYVADPERYIYEPNVSILKAGGFKSIANRYGFKKFHPSTHLYTHNQILNNFPGKIFQVIEIFDNGKNAMKLLTQQYAEVNVLLRNYPMQVVEYRKKYKLREGSSVYVIGLKNFDNKLINIVCTRIK